MKRQTVSAILGCVGLLASSVAAAQQADSEQQMLDRINALRVEQQLAPLARNDGLDAAARAHCADMAALSQLTHVSPSSGTPADRVRAAGVSVTTVAENVALHRTFEQAFEALIASEAHRGNMVNGAITHVGLAALRTEQGVYVTQVFATLAAPPPPPAPAEPLEEEEAEEAEEDDCVSPIPGVSFCGPLPAPSIEQVAPPALAPRVEQAPLPAPLPQAPLAAAPQAVRRPAGAILPQPGSNGTVLIERTTDNARIQAYWVFASGRWWYYPLTPGSRPGEQLRPDLTVSGPPPGFPAQPFAPRPIVPMRPRIFGTTATPPRTQTVVSRGGFYAVPPPPMGNQADRNWRRAHARWERNYRRWLRYQAVTSQRAL